MIFEPGDRVKLAELPVGELERILRMMHLDIRTCPNIIQPGEEAVVQSFYSYHDGSGGSCKLVGNVYNYPIEALQHACRNWQVHRKLRRAAAESATTPTTEEVS